MHHHGTSQSRLTDRDILTDLLMMAKQMIGAYGLAERESTHPQLRSTLHRLATEEEQFHTQAFQAMHQRGWYETPLADSNLAAQIASLWSGKLQQHAAAANKQYAGQSQSPWHAVPTPHVQYNQASTQQYGQPYAQQYGSAYGQSSGQQYGQAQQYGPSFGQSSQSYGTPSAPAAQTSISGPTSSGSTQNNA